MHNEDPSRSGRHLEVHDVGCSKGIRTKFAMMVPAPQSRSSEDRGASNRVDQKHVGEAGITPVHGRVGGRRKVGD